jgi:hypothetical protein
MLRGGDETDLQAARRYFGPFLFESDVLKGPDSIDAFWFWGERETSSRLIAIIVGQWLIMSTAMLFGRSESQGASINEKGQDPKIASDK